MSVSVDQVRYIAALAKLRFSEEEERRIARQMSGILDYVAKLNELDTENVPPMSHVLDLNNVFREDAVRQRVTRDEAFQNAPDAAAGYFKVPKVIE
ncbi:MAG TPA: Asp-tRNA(Asn)/Glu-tRNA(Gln) amidotransferase subunit GatC [Rhodothermales bacterium]|nr:Asp-tRNA(Asn)/Glu-tRNA(Gln) amidotransferase subunit GatC [Rhodothermales bacterium]